jgi:hypothetical protein
MAFCAAGSSVNVAVSACQGLSPGAMTQTISHGNKPRTPKTAIAIPQVRNQRRALACMVASTSALMMALSMLVMDSNTAKPRMVRAAVVISMSLLRH